MFHPNMVSHKLSPTWQQHLMHHCSSALSHQIWISGILRPGWYFVTFFGLFLSGWIILCHCHHNILASHLVIRNLSFHWFIDFYFSVHHRESGVDLEAITARCTFTSEDKNLQCVQWVVCGILPADFEDYASLGTKKQRVWLPWRSL